MIWILSPGRKRLPQSPARAGKNWARPLKMFKYTLGTSKRAFAGKPAPRHRFYFDRCLASRRLASQLARLGWNGDMAAAVPDWPVNASLTNVWMDATDGGVNDRMNERMNECMHRSADPSGITRRVVVPCHHGGIKYVRCASAHLPHPTGPRQTHGGARVISYKPQWCLATHNRASDA
jgi:hypothetical protein